MTPRQPGAQHSEQPIQATRYTVRAMVAFLFCSGMGELVINLIQRYFAVPCLVSVALAWASHVAALGR